jgi:NADH:ubiquinone oxidoreductase subunit E
MLPLSTTSTSTREGISIDSVYHGWRKGHVTVAIAEHVICQAKSIQTLIKDKKGELKIKGQDSNQMKDIQVVGS